MAYLSPRSLLALAVLTAHTVSASASSCSDFTFGQCSRNWLEVSI